MQNSDVIFRTREGMHIMCMKAYLKYSTYQCSDNHNEQSKCCLGWHSVSTVKNAVLVGR